MQINERDIEAHLVAAVAKAGGETRKVQWLCRRGAPDRVIMLPDRLLWVEVKAPGARPTEHQRREHARMALMGQIVHVVDSFAAAEEVLS